MKVVAGAVLCSIVSLSCFAEDVREPQLTPFSAHYVAEWKGIDVAVSDIELKAGATPGEYVYRWSIAARGLFRVVYNEPVIQTSWLKVTGGHAQPQRYRGEEGGSSVEVQFDWRAKRATGTSEKKPIDLPLENGEQDLNSIQVELMLDLRSGDQPKTFRILDKDMLKDFDYVWEGPARIRTELGLLDTMVVASHRKSNDRVLRMWFCPSLGFIPVKAERIRGGKLEFAMHIKRVEH